jgi:hypothetical protein
MVQAAARGVVDFSELDLQEPRHLHRLRLLLDGLVADNDRHKLLAQLQYYTALMTCQSAQEDYQKAREQAAEVLISYQQSFHYDLRKQAMMRRPRHDGPALQSVWEASFGKMDDPETQRGVQETVAALKKMRAEKAEARKRMAEARQKILARSINKRPQGRRGRGQTHG